MSPRTVNVAASVVRQTRARRKVVDLAEARKPRTRVVHGADEITGAPFAKVYFTRHRSADQVVDVSFLLKLPNAWAGLAKGFCAWGATVNSRTRSVRANDLRNGVVAYLLSCDCAAITLPQFADESILNGFVTWLNRPDATRARKPLRHYTRAHRLGALSAIFRALADDREHQSVALSVLAVMPTKRWPGGSRKSTPTARLSREHLASIVRAAEVDVQKISARFLEGSRLLEQGKASLASGRRDYADLSTCLAAVADRYVTFVPDLTVIRAEDESLWRGVNKSYGGFGHAKLTSYLYASARDLVPFVLLLATATVFNPVTILELDWACIEPFSRFGFPAVRIWARKGRATEDPMVVLDANPESANGVAPLLAQLKQITERIRPSVADQTHRTRLFVFVQRTKSKAPKGFTGGLCPSMDIVWKSALSSFIRDYQLDRFALNQIRPTLLDEVQLITGDLLEARAVGFQKNPQTLWRHYTSDGTKRRYQERIGEVFMLRERWRTTLGAIDPRTRVRTASMDRGAATPGFLCFDPFDSPRTNQVKGRICSAYGECPGCELAAADIGDPAAVALYSALRNAIYQSQGSVGPKAWTNKWAPILLDLSSLLDIVSADVRVQAAKLSITLPAIG